MAEVKLQYGIRKDGTVVHISALTQDEKGLKCNCTCPGCEALLQARLGEKRVPHFAHHEADECDIQIAQQTALHILAKDIIAKEKKVWFPPVTFKLSDTNAYRNLSEDVKHCYRYRLHWEEILMKASRSVVFDHVVLEKRVHTFVPDIVASVNGRECLIEIAVTHFVDGEKERKIRELGTSLLEIDLSSCSGDEATLRSILLNDSKYKKWVYNALWDTERERIETIARKRCNEYATEYAENQRKTEEADRLFASQTQPKTFQQSVGEQIRKKWHPY